MLAYFLVSSYVVIMILVASALLRFTDAYSFKGLTSELLYASFGQEFKGRITGCKKI